MRTPGDDLNLAVGFLLSEGVIPSGAAVRGHAFSPGAPAELRADTIELELHRNVDTRVTGRLTRTHEIRSSCGICGLTDPDELLEDTRALLPGTPRIPRGLLTRLGAEFHGGQALFAATGASHGAVVYDEHGTVLSRGEDVGRHNALDKALGAAALADVDLSRAIVLLSGRAGYDLAIKCLRLGVPILASLSASSALSFDLCSAAGGTLVGFLRGDKMTVYCDGGRLLD
jgi:FdhD protein